MNERRTRTRKHTHTHTHTDTLTHSHTDILVYRHTRKLKKIAEAAEKNVRQKKYGNGESERGRKRSGNKIGENFYLVRI